MPFDALINEIATKFNLGPKAAPFVAEVIRWMTAEPGGITGFLEHFRAAGLDNLVTSWLGSKDPAPLPAQQVEAALGADRVAGLAGRLGLGSGVIASALGYVVPKLVGMASADGSVPTAVPSSWQSFADTTLQAPGGASMRTVPPAAAGPAKRAFPKWLLWLLPLLILVGIAWWLMSGKDVSMTSLEPPIRTAVEVRPSLAVNYYNEGYVTYDGDVKDEAARSSVKDTLTSVFGTGNVFGDIKVNPDVVEAPWEDQLKEALEDLKIPGLTALFDGSSIKVGGLISDGDRDRVLSALKALFGGGFSFATLSGNVNSKAVAVLSSMMEGFSAQDLVKALNTSVINFASNSAEVPSYNLPLLQKAAEAMQKLPAGTVIEISGHTDSTGDATANMELSQARADAVRAVLISNGVPEAMLVAKGYGSTQPKASNDTAEGRYHNRRIEYAIVQ